MFSDIHGNKPALNTVLREIEIEKPDRVICLGDLVGYGPWPNEVIETIKQKNIPTIRGNYDEGVGYDSDDCGCAYLTEEERVNGQRSIEWTKAHVSSENKVWLKNLKNDIKIEVDGTNVLFVHGSPRRINEYLYDNRPSESLLRMLKPLAVDLLVCGHTHKPYHRIIDGIHIINCGSVGKPRDGDPRACYALIIIEENIDVDFRKVSYPTEMVANEILRVGLPEAFADSVLTGS